MVECELDRKLYGAKLALQICMELKGICSFNIFFMVGICSIQ